MLAASFSQSLCLLLNYFADFSIILTTSGILHITPISSLLCYFELMSPDSNVRMILLSKHEPNSVKTFFEELWD